jgi:serine/threonine-protein kinase
MLSVRPEARGTAGELAEALEKAARRAGPAADAPLFPKQAPLPEAEPTPHAPAESRGVQRRGWARFTTASLSAGVAFAVIYMANRYGWEASSPPEQATRDREERDGGTVGLGDAALTEPVAARQERSTWSPIGLDLPSEPLPGQLRPDSTGRCPHKSLVAINGGCWKKTDVDPKDCRDYFYEYNGACYQPILRPQSPPTSSPSDAPDGGGE